MVPTPQELSAEARAAPAQAAERVVISGMSGLFPMSRNVKELSENLYNKVNVITKTSRWSYNHPEVSPYIGVVSGLEKFDSQFFKVHYRLGTSMDSMSRKVLEQAYQAIYDAGVSPEHLYGKKVSVYMGSCFSETEKACFYVASSRTGFGIAGCSKAMFANRISYWLDSKGPSVNVDQACCSSIAALEKAYQDITSGECEAAIVAGANLSLHPQSSVHYGRIMTLCKDGKTKSFDENADGCAKSEAINVLFLQRAKDAKRVYAEVVYVKSEFTEIVTGETGPRYGFYRDPMKMAEFMKQFYKHVDVAPEAVEFVEAFGSAVPEVDKAELEALANVYCKERENPLLVGSVMSNIGYSEAASGISAITKVALGYHTGVLSGNLHCESPRRDLDALRDGRMRILTDHQPFGRGYTAVNGISATGCNAHVLLHGHYKPKDINRYKSSIPHLVTISARQDTAVQNLLNDLKSRPIDPEEIALFHNIHSTRISGHLGRGYVILKTNESNETVRLAETANYFDDAKRPLWFVYSGMGSQWAGMGIELMRIPVFAAAIERCRKVLEPKGVDIIHILTSPDNSIFDNILNSFVGIAAVQIGLTDILTALGIVPDKIIGHSVGELGCAYADGCFTAEEMILSAYSRGLVSVQTPFIRGSMAAVGIGYEQVRQMLPPEIAVACHNGPESSTISGPADVMRQFVAKLVEQGIFAKEVPCSNIAYHSRYIAEAGPGLLKYLNDVIKSPKPRSERWVSTSVPKERWHEPAAKVSSAEYHTNNLLNPVLFEETSRLIPADAVLIEIAPHGLLQAILKRSLPATCSHIPLTRRNHPDNAFLVLDAIGKLFMQGYNPKVDVLYPKVEFPVSTGTPMLSHLVEWAHDETWNLPLYASAHRKQAAVCNFVVSIHDDEHKYLRGHIIRGQIVYPFAGALVAAWDTLAMSLHLPRRHTTVEFTEVQLLAPPPLHDARQLRLSVALHRGNGRFEVLDEGRTIMTGFIGITMKDDTRHFDVPFETNEEMTIESEGVYQFLLERGYFYQDEFRSIHRVNPSLTESQIIWNDNWVTFLDGVLQMSMLRRQYECVSQPYEIRRICIDIDGHFSKIIENVDDRTVVTAQVLDMGEIIRCGGVLIENIKFKDLPAIKEDAVALKVLKFVPGFQSTVDDVWGGDCCTPLQETATVDKGVTLRIGRIGDLESLHWVEAPVPSGPGVLVNVHYAAINDIDVKRATGVIQSKDENKSETSFGVDFSGTTDSGKRVMGIVSSGAASGLILARPELLWPVPDHWSLEDAATVPFAYALAFYCLALKVTLRRGLRVLVHGGAGALGQAVISIALANGCEVFTTVSDVRKKRFLLRLFPDLKEDHIGNSRDSSFGDMVRLIRKGEGCDVVISCVKGELKDVSFNCCARFGIMLDLTQIPNREKYYYGLANLNWERNYMPVDIFSIFKDERIEEIKRIQLLMCEGISRGYVRPLSRVTYAPGDAPRAFRLLAASRHRGRALLRLHPAQTFAAPRLSCSPDLCHLVLCYEGGFGLQLADRLVNRGARKLLLHFVTAPSYLPLKIQSWEKLGVKVRVSTEDLNSNKGIVCLLSESSRLGAVEGAYVVATQIGDNGTNTAAAVVDKLDLASRKLCPSIKYFAVVSTGNTVGQQTCLSRVRDGLPVTILHVPTLRKLNDISSTSDQIELMSWRGAIDAIERAIRSSQPALLAHSRKISQPTLLQEIAHIADIDVSEDTLDDVTLLDLGIELARVPAIASFLMDVHNVALDENVIPTLTIHQIRELEVTFKGSKLKDVKGLETYFTFVDADELTATTEMIFLPTLFNSLTTRDDEYDVTQTYLCVIPGLEGHHGRFQTLCERLKLPALVLQPGLDHLNETVRQTAERYAEHLLKKFQLKDNFYLLGYESGVLVALEVAAILEEHGMRLTGTVYCVGETPEEFQQSLEKQLRDFDTEEHLQEAVARHMFSLMTGSTDGLDEALERASSWKEKVEVCVRMLLGRVAHSAQYARALMEAAYSRIRQAREYKVKPRPLRSLVVLLHATTEPMEGTGRDCAQAQLQRYSAQPVRVEQLSLPLAHATSDLRCAAIINRLLGPEILNAFDQKNLCDTYLFNTDLFMTVATEIPNI